MFAVRFVLIAIVLNCLFNLTIQKAIEKSENPIVEKKIIHTVKRSELIEDMNTCIDACSECLQENLLNEEVDIISLNQINRL